MLNRRQILTAAAGTGVAAALASPVRAAAQQSASAGDKTWLTYAVNAEMFWNKLPFEERLRKVAEAGFTHYEFWPWKNKDIDKIAAVNKELGLQPTQFTGYWGITSPEKRGAFVADIKAAVPVAQKLGVTKMTVVAGETTKGMSHEEQTRAVVETLKLGAEIVGPAGIMIILEPLNILVNHPGQHVVTSAHAAEIVKAVGSPHVKILFDVYHQQISEGNLTGNIRKYKDLIGYYQVADHPGRNEPGTGEINYAHVLRTIHDVGYRDPIGLELNPKGDPAEAIKAVRLADAAARDRK